MVTTRRLTTSSAHGLVQGWIIDGLKQAGKAIQRLQARKTIHCDYSELRLTYAKRNVLIIITPDTRLIETIKRQNNALDGLQAEPQGKNQEA